MPKTILVIEDDFDLLWMIRKLLEMKGHQVLTAVTAEQGIDQFSRNIFSIECILLDLSLPDMDGEAVYREIQKVRPELPVIITTGSEDRGQRQRLEASGVSAYLVKPFDLTRLVELIETLV